MIKRVTIDTNPDICNLKCIMCDTHSIYNKSKTSHRVMTKELLELTLDNAIKHNLDEVIPTTMGEPLLYQYFDIFIDKLSNSNTKLNLTTNGTKLLSFANKILPILSDVKISINSIDSIANEKIMINDDTNQKLEIIKQFILLKNQINPKATVTLQVTFLRSNIDYLEDLIKFAIDIKADRVKGHHLWVTHQELSDETLHKDNASKIIWNDFIEKIEKYKTQIKLENFDKIDLNSDNASEKSLDCPFLNNELWIDYNGDYNICCAPSTQRVSLGEWGNIKDKNFSQIVDSKEYIELVSTYKSKEVCKKCPLKK